MTSKTSRNALLVACGVAAAAGVWAVALLLPPPAPRAPPAPVTPVAEAVAPTEPEPAPAPPMASPPPTFANIDPAAFGVLPASMSSAPVTSLRMTMVDATAPLALSSTSTLQSIGSTFAEPPPGTGLPDMGGASALDGPADAGLDDRVAQAAAAEPKAPPPKGKIIVIDASEGTRLDPLRQRNWDLNATQVIPPSVPTTQR